MTEIKHIIPHNYQIDKAARAKANAQKPLIVWLTGLSGSGKSTIANQLEKELYQLGYKTYLLDGDNVRMGLCKDLGFSEEDRNENIRRIGEVAKLFVDSGTIVLSAFVSPFKADRNQVRDLVNADEFVEVYVNCPVEVCEQRDTKGLYAKARRGEITNFTGISSPFEAPENPEVEVFTDKEELSESVNKVLDLLKEKIKLQ